jgi:hypothetical protein
MKRCVATLVALGCAWLVQAQAPFTIVRPADGSKVREKVHFLIPKNSVPDDGYIGVFTTTTDSSGNQKRRFIEGVIPRTPSKNPDYQDYVPDKKSKFVEYVLDTKAMSIPDGPVNVELVLYVQYGDQPRVVDRSSVDLTIANSASIKIPDDGFKLRYKFIPGMEYVYDVEQRVSIATLTEAQNQMGARPGDLPLEAERVRLLYAIDNVYPNGDALIRSQALPTMGLDYAYLTAEGDTAPKKFMDYEMASTYSRITNTGMEVFGSVPLYWPLGSVSGEGNVLDLFAIYPWPTLPDAPRRPADSWQSRFQEGSIDLANVYEQSKVTSSALARGEFLRVEWESGFPCAVLRNSFSASNPTKEAARLAAAGSNFTTAKETMEETIWFALDRGIVVKSIRTLTLEGKITVAAAGGMGGQGGPAGMPGARGGTSMPGGVPGGRMPGAPGAPSGGAGGSDDKGQVPTGGPGGAQSGMKGGLMGGPPGYGGPGARGGTRSGGTGGGSQTRFIRQIIQAVFTLEQ